MYAVFSPTNIQFLLTRPLRDVTVITCSFGFITRISTHTPLAGRDDSARMISMLLFLFLLTRPLRDVTMMGYIGYMGMIISTHTPLAGRDAILVNQ